MFVTNWISTTKIQKISEITNFFRHYFLSRTEVILYGIDVKHRIWQIAKPMPSSIIILLLTLCSKVKVELAQCNNVRATSAKCRMK